MFGAYKGADAHHSLRITVSDFSLTRHLQEYPQRVVSQNRFTKKRLFLYSLALSFCFQFVAFGFAYAYYLSGSDSTPFTFADVLDSDIPLTALQGFVQTSLFIFLYWLFIRWVASTAERAGRSYSAFMILSIFLPPVAWIVAITFRKPAETSQTDAV